MIYHNILLGIAVVFFTAALSFIPVHAETIEELQQKIEARNQELQALEAEIAKFEAELLQVGADRKTLEKEITNYL